MLGEAAVSVAAMKGGKGKDGAGKSWWLFLEVVEGLLDEI